VSQHLPVRAIHETVGQQRGFTYIRRKVSLSRVGCVRASARNALSRTHAVRALAASDMARRRRATIAVVVGDVTIAEVTKAHPRPRKASSALASDGQPRDPRSRGRPVRRVGMRHDRHASCRHHSKQRGDRAVESRPEVRRLADGRERALPMHRGWGRQRAFPTRRRPWAGSSLTR